jgi:hypothetical protein
MPARSKAQQQAMAIAEHNPSELYGRNRGLLKMSHQQLHDFASTPRKELPAKVKHEKKADSPKVKPHFGFRSVMKASTGKLSTEERKELPKSKFGLPGARKYPVNDRGHAVAAKARATQQVNAGNLSPSSKAQIDRKANAVLGEKKASKPAASVKNPFAGPKSKRGWG